jgi:Uma2 family endonuclease
VNHQTPEIINNSNPIAIKKLRALAAWREKKRENPMPATSTTITYAELASHRTESTAHTELWDGQICWSPSPSYRHQKIVLNLAMTLSRHAQASGLGEILTAPIDVVLSEHRVVQPDIVFLSSDNLDRARDVIHGPVDLAIEVISVGTRHRDRIEKRDLYQQHGIPEYWLIDPEAATVEILKLENGEYHIASHARTKGPLHSPTFPDLKLTAEAILLI